MGLGIYGNGMHLFVLRELEIGARAATYEDSEHCGWSALDDLSFTEYWLARKDSNLQPGD